VVLIAGGRNKGLNLSPIAQADNVRFLIAIGESASELLAAAGSRPARRAESLLDAISIATDIAAPGDTVLLSPGCASFDMFSSYGERGDEFTRLVHEAKEGAR
jgi:UDP-N-acetylmuramoylalanine--D-glutamate ligase